MLKTIPQYLSAIIDTYGLTKTLGVIDICRGANDELEYYVGNNSVIFHIRHEGRDKMLKCYTRAKRNLRRIYKEKCLHEELYIHSDSMQGEWVDVILDDWIEGKNLHRAILDNRNNPEAMQALAETFDEMALQLLREEWAHGDLKPENIIVTPDGQMRLIDFDAVFLPEFAGEQSEECGTAAFQHPNRTSEYFDKSIDDYPIALISTALHALATDYSLAERYDIEDMLLFAPKEIVAARSKAYSEVLGLFVAKGMALQYRIAQMLSWRTPQLPPLRELLGYANYSKRIHDLDSYTELIPTQKDLYWGYCRNGEFAIPPIYDLCFEFSGDKAVVCIGGDMHNINKQGVIVPDSQPQKR